MLFSSTRCAPSESRADPGDRGGRDRGRSRESGIEGSEEHDVTSLSIHYRTANFSEATRNNFNKGFRRRDEGRRGTRRRRTSVDPLVRRSFARSRRSSRSQVLNEDWIAIFAEECTLWKVLLLIGEIETFVNLERVGFPFEKY